MGFSLACCDVAPCLCGSSAVADCGGAQGGGLDKTLSSLSPFNSEKDFSLLCLHDGLAAAALDDDEEEEEEDA